MERGTRHVGWWNLVHEINTQLHFLNKRVRCPDLVWNVQWHLKGQNLECNAISWNMFWIWLLRIKESINWSTVKQRIIQFYLTCYYWSGKKCFPIIIVWLVYTFTNVTSNKHIRCHIYKVKWRWFILTMMSVNGMFVSYFCSDTTHATLIVL